MNIVDLLVTIVVVTILVTIVLAVVTYVAYKLRLAREPHREEMDDGPRYFVQYRPPTTVGTGADDDEARLKPPGEAPAGAAGAATTGRVVASAAGIEGHASEA